MHERLLFVRAVLIIAVQNRFHTSFTTVVFKELKTDRL